MQRKIDLEKMFRTEKLQMVIGGFYPRENNKRKFLYALSAGINSLIPLIQFVAAIAFLYYNYFDVTNVSKVLSYGTTHFAFICKLMTFVLHKNEIVQLELKLKTRLFTEVSSKEEVILLTSTKSIRTMTNIYRTLCVLSVVFFALYPLADGGIQTQEFPVPGWFPLDSYNYYYPIYIFQALGVCLCAWFNSALDLLLVIMMALGKAQFDVLRYRLKDVATNACGEKEVKERLKECARHYKSITRFVTLTETVFSRGILVQFLCSGIVICVTGFQMLVISLKSMQFIQRIVYLNCMMFQIAMYCWYGQRLTDSSDKITEACYAADWRNCSVSVRKSLLIIMERAKYPAKVEACNVFTVDLPTLMMILRSSYSYFALIYNLYTKP